jgi:hypothetical protein
LADEGLDRSQTLRREAQVMVSIVVSIDPGRLRHFSDEMQANRVICREITARCRDLGDIRSA